MYIYIDRYIYVCIYIFTKIRRSPPPDASETCPARGMTLRRSIYIYIYTYIYI